jgi:hypothetical protein
MGSVQPPCKRRARDLGDDVSGQWDIVSLSLDGQLIFTAKGGKFSAIYLLPPLSPGNHTFTLVTISSTDVKSSDDFLVTAN